MGKRRGVLTYGRIGAGAAAVALLLAAPAPAFAKAAKKGKADAAPICDIPAISISSDKEKNDDSGDHRYLLGSFCVDLSGNIQATGQAATVHVPQAGGSQSPASQNSITIKPDIRIETSMPTGAGPLTTAFEIDWTYDTSKGMDQTVNPDEASASYLGFTAGYTDSLMDFWDGSNFQFSATAPTRSSYLAAYQRSLTDETTLAVAIEAGPATTRGAEAWQMPNSPPYYTARFRYDKDDWTVHASAAFHELDVRAPPLLTGPVEKKNGWAASTGLTVPLGFVAEDDAASVQLAYAVNSSIFLGTQSDVSYLAAVLPVTGGTKGWSGVASYLHNWNEDWTSNVFVSRLEIAADLLFTHPSVKTTRTGANVVWQIDEKWQAGVEVDYIDARIDPDGTFGLIRGQSLSGQTAYVWLQWEF